MVFGLVPRLWAILNPCIASGRLRFDASTGRWAISFSENDGVPLTVGTTTLPSIMSADFNHQVRSDAARRFVLSLLIPVQKHPDYVNEHPYMLSQDPMTLGKQPLITLKVVTGTSARETTLTLGNATSSILHLHLTFQYQDGATYAVRLQYDYFTL